MHCYGLGARGRPGLHAAERPSAVGNEGAAERAWLGLRLAIGFGSGLRLGLEGYG